MLAIDRNPPSTTHKLTPNILPCSIKHSGPIRISKRYWSPSRDSDGTSTSYFRGRKLRGRTLKLPEGYAGYVLQKTDKTVEQKPASKPHTHVDFETVERVDDELDEENENEVKLMEQRGTFDEIVVWGHEVAPEEDDEYVKGVQEWIAFAEAVRHIQLSTDGP